MQWNSWKWGQLLQAGPILLSPINLSFHNLVSDSFPIYLFASKLDINPFLLSTFSYQISLFRFCQDGKAELSSNNASIRLHKRKKVYSPGRHREDMRAYRIILSLPLPPPPFKCPDKASDQFVSITCFPNYLCELAYKHAWDARTYALTYPYTRTKPRVLASTDAPRD